MRIALCQIDCVIADFRGNADKILVAVQSVLPEAPELIVFPEMTLSGYPPMDLLDNENFAAADEAAFKRLIKALPRDIPVAIGHIDRNTSGRGHAFANSLSLVLNGEVVFRQDKTLLPTYDVFDEARYFEPASQRRLWEYNGRRIGFAICEDVWCHVSPVAGMRYAIDPTRDLVEAGADMIIVPSASPYQKEKLALRVNLCAELARSAAIPVAYCNAAGASDSLVFDGRSFLVDKNGTLAALSDFGDAALVCDSDALAETAVCLPHDLDELELVLVEGIRGYMKKCGFKTAHLGLSGGIDSALVAVLAVKAVGPDHVTCISLPSRFSSEGSVRDSIELAESLGCRLETISIEESYAALLHTMETHYAGLPFSSAEENMQARIRGAILMAWSNKFNSMLLTTGNKSELAVGYCTLYGDMCGALNPIGDLYKTEVFDLCEHIHERDGLIPRSILDKPPSAELRPNQKDEDSLPPYNVLDAILKLYIEDEMNAEAIARRGYDAALVRSIVLMTARAEYKRRQAAPAIKISKKAFGLGRRIPMARAVYEVGQF